MPLFGDLVTMPLSDVLQWIGVSQKTGVLEVERGNVRRRIEFTKGLVGGVHGGDQGSDFGQLLVARGLISQEQLQAAVAQHESAGNRLGFILVQQRALDEKEVRRWVTAHVEQTIQCLLEWNNAVFRFHEGASFDPVRVEVSLSIHDMLLRTLQYQDELKQIRQVLGSSGIVLRPTQTPPPAELTESEMSHKIFRSIDGSRTIGGVVAAAAAQEILVLKLLHRLVTMGIVEVAETRPLQKGTATLLDPLTPFAAPDEVNLELQRLGLPDSGPTEELGADAELRVTQQLLLRGEYGAALALLEAACRAYPEDSRIPRVLAEVEAAGNQGDAVAGIQESLSFD